MKEKSAAERIMDAIIPPVVHPLHKSPCKACGAPTCEKDLDLNLRICLEKCYPEYVMDQEQRHAERVETEITTRNEV